MFTTQLAHGCCVRGYTKWTFSVMGIKSASDKTHMLLIAHTVNMPCKHNLFNGVKNSGPKNSATQQTTVKDNITEFMV